MAVSGIAPFWQGCYDIIRVLFLTSSTKGLMLHHYIYKIAARPLWEEAEQRGVFSGAEIDIRDGYIHFSSQDQVAETLALHFAGQSDLVLVEVDTAHLDIKWEPSRGGQLFPHLYSELPFEPVRTVWPLALNARGQHILPPLPLAT